MNNPGWVDLQVNGHNGVNFSDPQLTAEAICHAVDELYQAGTAVFLPTLVTSAWSVYQRNLPLLSRTIEQHGWQQQVPGVHLEGPFISCQGSHDPRFLQEFTPAKLQELQDFAAGSIKLLTLGADLPQAQECIKTALQLHIIPSIGHHQSGYDDMRRAADAGCKLLTHLGNACPNLVNRHENPLLAGLAEDRLTAMVIADSHHLPPELLKIIFRVKSADKIIVSSDSCHACGYKPGHYNLWGNDAVLTPEGKLWNPAKNCLVASVATMQKCLNFLASQDWCNEADLLKVGRTNALKMLNML